MTEEKKIIDFSEDSKLVQMSDKLTGFNRILDDYAVARGRLTRELVKYVHEKYDVTFDTHIIDHIELKLKPRKDDC